MVKDLQVWDMVKDLQVSASPEIMQGYRLDAP
jgi:hypothetical protein